MVDDNSNTVEAMLQNHSGQRNPLEERERPCVEEADDIWADVTVTQNPDTYALGGIVRDRDEINDKFLDVVNTVEPEHPYSDNPYPLTHNDIKYSYCQSSGRYYARCGPQRYSGYKVVFAADKEYLGSVTRERLYVVLIHEATHITEGSHSPGSVHNPTFWRKFAKNCRKFAEEGSAKLNLNDFVGHARGDPNGSMVDRRMITVEEQREQIVDDIMTP